MRSYVRLQRVYGETVVVEVITADDITTRYHPAFVADLIEVTDVEPQPDQWWRYKDDEFLPPAA